jgi:hypothetical protein
MPATPADIAAASRDALVVTWADASIAARYPTARDGTLSPALGNFDAATDAQTVVNARGALIGTERRRFAVEVHDVIWPDVSLGVPTATLVDVEQSASGSFLAARIEVDLDAVTTNLELFG